MSTKKKPTTLTFKVSQQVTKQITLPAYYDEAAYATYVYHDGKIKYRYDYDFSDTPLRELTSRLNDSLTHPCRDDNARIKYLKGLAKLVEDTIALTKKKPVTRKKKPVTRKKK